MTALEVLNKVKIELGGETLTLRAKHSAIIAIEEELGKPWAVLGDMCAEGLYGYREVTALVYHGLRGNGDDRKTRDEIGELIVEAGIKRLIPSIIQFVQIGFRGAKPLGKPEDAAAPQG